MLRTLLLSFILLHSFSASSQFINLITDPVGDGSDPNLLDGTSLSYFYDSAKDSLWFKIDVANLNGTTSQALGVNIMINVAGAGNTFNFWGSAPNSDPYHFLLTTWVTGSAPSNYSGTIGIADASGVNSSSFTNLSSNNVSVTVDMAAGSIILGLKRDALFPDALFTNNNVVAKIAAAVGSNQFWNDDIYNNTINMSLSKSSVGLEEYVLNIAPYPNPVVDKFSFENPRLLSGGIYNALGQLAKKFDPELHQTIDLSGFDSGLYFLVFTNGQSKSIIKK